MGMYDIIMVTMNCPYCGHFVQIEYQTKDLSNSLNVYHIEKYKHEPIAVRNWNGNA
jgi:hypothetical protein